MAKKTVDTSMVGTKLGKGDICAAILGLSKTTDVALTKAQVETVYDLFQTVACDAITKGQTVQMTGFLSITPVYKAARNGNNIKTGTTMVIPESIAPNCKTGIALKNATKNISPEVMEAIKAKSKKN